MHELPPAPSSAGVSRRAEVIVAGYQGDAALVEAAVDDPDPLVREAALGAQARLGRLDAEVVRAAMTDRSPRVRRRAAELAISVPGVDPVALLTDRDASVVETACFACGEIEWPAGAAPVDELAAVVRDDTDALCREAAAAALGAIGDQRGLEAVLEACNDRVTVRRRATLALAAFDDPRADQALERALDDADWQVRQAAEDLLEVGRVLDGDPDPDAFAD